MILSTQDVNGCQFSVFVRYLEIEGGLRLSERDVGFLRERFCEDGFISVVGFEEGLIRWVE